MPKKVAYAATFTPVGGIFMFDFLLLDHEEKKILVQNPALGLLRVCVPFPALTQLPAAKGCSQRAVVVVVVVSKMQKR